MALNLVRYKSIKSRFISYMIQILLVSLVISLVMIYGILQITISSYILPANYYEDKMPIVRESINEYGNDLERLHQELFIRLPKVGMNYKIIDALGSSIHQHGQIKVSKMNWWDLSKQDTEQELVEGWIKPYVFRYLPIFYKGNYQGAVILGYGLYNTSTLPILKYIAPNFNLIIIGIPFAVLAITLILYAKRFLKAIEEPLRVLKKGISSIEEDNLEFEVKTNSQDEIGALCLSFEKMRMTLKESLKTNWEKEEERKNIISGLAHDLRTPITVIKGRTELMLEGILTTQQMKDSTLAIQKNADRLITLVEALNQINKWQQIDLLEAKQEVELESFFEEKIKDYSILAKTKGIELKYQIESTYKSVYLYSDVFHQILDNLISNSIRFTPNGGSIHILFKVAESGMKLRVEDSGYGFTTEDLKQGFTLLYQGDKSRNSGQHYGIGLYTVDYLVKKMNGTTKLYHSLLGGAGVEATWK